MYLLMTHRLIIDGSFISSLLNVGSVCCPRIIINQRNREQNVCLYNFTTLTGCFLPLCSYQYSVILLSYLLPLLVMLVTYSLVGQSLWGGHIPGEATDHYHSQITAKRKVTHV